MDAPTTMQAAPPARPGGGALVPASQATGAGATVVDAPGWSLEVAEGPNKGAVVPLDGETRIGSGLDNDVVLADAAMADSQALFVPDGERCLLDPLAGGIRVNGRPAPTGRFVVLRDGMLVQAGDTTIRVHGPPVRRRRTPWLLAAVPALLAAVGIAALVGTAAPGRNAGQAQQAVQPPPQPPPPATQAADALRQRLREAGLGDDITVRPEPGMVVATGAVTGPMLARWKELLPWFDARFTGLPLRNLVNEAAPDDKPSIQLRAVSLGAVPYLIVASGDRYVIGSVVDGWLVESIESDKIVFSKGAKRAEMRLQ